MPTVGLLPPGHGAEDDYQVDAALLPVAALRSGSNR